MDGKPRKMVPAVWRTGAVALVGVVAGAVALSPALGKGGGGTLSGKTHVDVKLVSISPTGPTKSHTTIMKCPKGNVAVGGGLEFQDPNADIKVTTNGPAIGTGESLLSAGPGLSASARAWQVHVIDQSDTRPADYAIGVVCANVK